MISSMTGFGRCEKVTDARKVLVEIKSVNHRYLDLNLKMPKNLNGFEADIRNIIKEHIYRGKIDLYITYEEYDQSNCTVKYRKEIAKEYMDHFSLMAKDFSIENDVKVSHLARFPEIFTMEQKQIDDGALFEHIKEALLIAVEQFVTTRSKEGEHLKIDITEKLDQVLEYVEKIQQLEPLVINNYKDKLKDKVRELLKEETIDEARILTEVTLFADKICVDEETIRLKAHVLAMKDTLNEGGSIGRKLDFITQEMNREANTILSKSNDLEISNMGILLKTMIEKIREQIQNIE